MQGDAGGRRSKRDERKADTGSKHEIMTLKANSNKGSSCEGKVQVTETATKDDEKQGSPRGRR